jgi:uncharacterized protein YpmB
MGFFDPIKPRVTPKEFKKVRSELASEGLSKKKRDRVEGLLDSDMNEKRKVEQGISEDEIDEKIEYMKAHKNIHGLTDKEIEEVDKALRKRL